MKRAAGGELALIIAFTMNLFLLNLVIRLMSYCFYIVLSKT